MAIIRKRANALNASRIYGGARVTVVTSAAWQGDGNVSSTLAYTGAGQADYVLIVWCAVSTLAATLTASINGASFTSFTSSGTAPRMMVLGLPVSSIPSWTGSGNLAFTTGTAGTGHTLLAVFLAGGTTLDTTPLATTTGTDTGKSTSSVMTGIGAVGCFTLNPSASITGTTNCTALTSVSSARTAGLLIRDDDATQSFGYTLNGSYASVFSTFRAIYL